MTAGDAPRPGPRPGLLRRFLAGIGRLLRKVAPRERPLCDTCKYDYGNVCTRPERPNAFSCPDYKHR